MIRFFVYAAFILLPAAAQAQVTLSICVGDFALCAASGAERTGNTIVVNGKTFWEGRAVCPVLHGPAVANLALMNGSCSPLGPGKVWSLFSARSSFPQAPSWADAPAIKRTFVTVDSAAGGASNLWSFPCVVRPQPVNGVQLADCFGPINESPWNNDHVQIGGKWVTDAPIGVPNPVGGNLP